MRIALRCIVAGITLLFLGTVVQAQTLIGGKIQLFSSGVTPYTLIITPPAGLSSDVTYTLPTSSGTLLINSGSGVSNAWLLGGNDLSGPADNRIGSTTAHDLILIAGGGSNTRLTLLNSVNAVEVNGGELRFVESGGTEYSSFKSGAQTNSITYTWPTTTPAVNEVLQATSVTGNDVVLGWEATGGTTTTVTKSANQTTTNNNYLDVQDIAIPMQPGKHYRFTIMLELQKSANGGGDPTAEIEWDAPAGTLLSYVNSNGRRGSHTTTDQEIATIQQ